MEFCSRIEFKKISDFHLIICKFHNCVYNTLEASVERLLCERSKFLNGILQEFNWELAKPRSETSWIKLPDKSRLLRLLRLQKTALGRVHKLLPLKKIQEKATSLWLSCEWLTVITEMDALTLYWRIELKWKNAKSTFSLICVTWSFLRVWLLSHYVWR